MKTETYFHQFKSNFFYGARIVVAPTLLINIFFILFLSIGLEHATWDIEFIDGVIISLLIVTPFLLFTFLGIAIISLVISSNKRFSNIAGFTLGALTGTVVVVIGNLISILFELMSFEFTSLPSIATIVLLAYAGTKMNKQANLDTEIKSTGLELRTVLLRTILRMAVIACIGSIAYVLHREGYLDILSIYINLGYALSISLPIVFLTGLLIGFFIKKIPKPAFLNWSLWQRVSNTIRWATTSIQKRIGIRSILKTVVFALFAYGAFFGITYFLLKIPSDRELWRITDYSVSEPIVVNDLFIFHGYKEDRSIDCYCLYAVNKSTGEIVWSTEKLAKPYMEEVQRLGLGSSDSFSVGTGIEFVSQTHDTIYVSLNYWASDYGSKYVLFAIRSENGEILWKVDGMVDSDSFSDSITKINRILVVNDNGDLLAIDSHTGKEIWRRNVYPIYDEDYTWFAFHNNTVVISTHSSECLKCCCTFKSDEQQYEQIAAYSAETGQPLWESARLDSGRIYTLNKTLYMVSRPWENSSDIEKRDDNLVTAIDFETGKKRWDLIFENAHEFGVAIGAKNETLFFIRTYEGGWENFHELGKLIVVDEFTGKTIWNFNDDFSSGNLGYLINGNSVYVGAENGFVYSLDSTTGKILWQTKTGDFPFYFIFQGNSLISVYEKNYISAFDIKTGSQKWKLNLGIDESWSIFWDEIIKNNNDTIFIAGNNNQRIYAIDINSGNEHWTWSHFHPTKSEYTIGLVDKNVLYVNQQPKRSIFGLFMPDYFARDDWYFAIRTEPK